jgi:hypothetical protein
MTLLCPFQATVATMATQLAAAPKPAASSSAPAAPPASATFPSSPPPQIPSPAPSTSAGAAPLGRPSPTAPSSALPSAAPSPTPLPGASPTASPFQYRFVPHVNPSPAPGEPQIFEVDLNNKVLRSKGPIDILVLTNPDVTKVVSGGSGRSGVVPQVAPGRFETHSKLPAIPFMASGTTYNLRIVASTAAGRSITVIVPVQLR